MAEQITNYQCPACTGPLHYAANSGNLECEYCGSSFTVQEIEALFEEKEEAAIEASLEEAEESTVETEEVLEADGDYDTGEYWDAEAEGLKAYTCPSCAAQLIMDETTVATSCPYCGNPSVVPGAFAKTLKPEYIIPFKVTREEAKKALKKYYKGKKFLPKSFAAENNIEELKGVYVPFWLYNGKVYAQMSYRGTKVRTTMMPDCEVVSTYHYRMRRAGTADFERIPVDASSKMPDEYMDAIEPFDYSQMVKFKTAYLPGYMADRYDEDIEQCAQRAENRAINSAVSSINETVQGFSTCVTETQHVTVHREKVNYALLPVWMMSTRWKDKSYLFAMNGQTGLFVGELPVDKGRYWAMFAKIALPVAAVLAFLLY